MIEGVIGLLTVLIVVLVVYLVVKWIATKFPIPANIVDVVFGGVALIIILRYLVTFIK